MSAAPESGLVLALGGGGAPGLAHIGVLEVLEERGIAVRAVAGTSIGAEIGAFFATGMPVADLVRLATAVDWKQTLQLFLPDLPTGGLVSGEKIMDFLRDKLGARRIEELAIGYAAITADLESGGLVVVDSGDLVEAVRASISLPGVVAPLRRGSQALVDGGVLNPLPFDVARALFGGPVVAVATHAGACGRQRVQPAPPRARQWMSRARQLLDQPWIGRAPALRDWLRTQIVSRESIHEERPYWTARRVLDRAYSMAQSEIVSRRAADSPPDLVITPEVGSIGLLEFYRAAEAIDAGRVAARECLPQLQRLVRSLK
jgi:NTE family protein